ncbi:hypothetical protein DL96DRAFT_1596774 [Flagelloscypha sp. PMI_526]|nr:hypothetical protein DL96DRAFT_1596774 [Flagelloscypha sp. PMI_526]
MTNFIGNLPHDLEHLKSTSAQALEAVEILLDQDAEYARGKSVRELTAMKSQQVNEFLRDKLQTSGLEIIEAQNQIAKLEASSEERWREHCSTLSGVQSELRAVVDALQGEKQELVKDKKDLLHQIELLTTITSEQDTLKAHLAEKEIVIDTQKAVAFAEHKRSEDLKTRLDELALTLNVRDTDIRQLQERLDAHETRLQDLLTQNQALRVQTRLKEEILNLTAELNQFKPRASVLEAERTLQERFETLTMNLQLSKDERLDLQESLTSTQRELDATSKTNVQLNEDLATLQADMVKLTLIHESTKNDAISPLRGELERAQRTIVTTQDTGLKAELTFKDRSLFALEERLQLREDEHSSASKQRSLEHAASIRVFEERLHHRESEHNDAIHVYKERCQVTEKLLDSFETQTEALKKQVVHLSAEIEGVRDDLNAAQARPLVVPGDGGDLQAARIDELTLENSALTTTISSLQTLASTLPQRFEKGELSEGERNFVNGVVKTTRAIHEEQLVARGNELRRKDNAIMKLQSQVKELQASLARCLKDKGDETDKTSIVDLFLSNGSNVRDSRSMAHPPALDSNISKPHSTKKVPVKAIENVSIDQMERDESISSISDAGDLPMMPVLGKRGRGPTPTGPIEHARPIRRAHPVTLGSSCTT